ncbi:LPS export ABC transporter permease LptF, partial [Vibrio sp. 10N.222.49.C9]
QVLGMWPMNIGLLVVGLALNSMDSLPVRRWKDKIRQKRAA